MLAWYPAPMPSKYIVSILCDRSLNKNAFVSSSLQQLIIAVGYRGLMSIIQALEDYGLVQLVI